MYHHLYPLRLTEHPASGRDASGAAPCTLNLWLLVARVMAARDKNNFPSLAVSNFTCNTPIMARPMIGGTACRGLHTALPRRWQPRCPCPMKPLFQGLHELKWRREWDKIPFQPRQGPAALGFVGKLTSRVDQVRRTLSGHLVLQQSPISTAQSLVKSD